MLPSGGATTYHDDLYLPSQGQALKYKAGGKGGSVKSGTVWSGQTVKSPGNSRMSGTVWSAKLTRKSAGAPSRGAASQAAHTIWSDRAGAAGHVQASPLAKATAAQHEADSQCPAEGEDHALSDLRTVSAASSADLRAMPRGDGFVEASKARGRARAVEWCVNGFARCRLCPRSRPCTDPAKARQLLRVHFRTHHKNQTASGNLLKTANCLRWWLTFGTDLLGGAAHCVQWGYHMKPVPVLGRHGLLATNANIRLPSTLGFPGSSGGRS